MASADGNTRKYTKNEEGWLRNPKFDFTFVQGVAGLVSGCENTEHTHCLRAEVRLIYMPVCVPNNAIQRAHSEDVGDRDQVVWLARECDDSYKRDDPG